MNLWWAAAIVVTATAVAVLALLLIRRWAPHGGHFADTGRAAGVFGILRDLVRGAAGVHDLPGVLRLRRHLLGRRHRGRARGPADRDGPAPPARPAARARLRTGLLRPRGHQPRVAGDGVGVGAAGQPVGPTHLRHLPPDPARDRRPERGLRQVARPDLGARGRPPRPDLGGRRCDPRAALVHAAHLRRGGAGFRVLLRRPWRRRAGPGRPGRRGHRHPRVQPVGGALPRPPVRAWAGASAPRRWRTTSSASRSGSTGWASPSRSCAMPRADPSTRAPPADQHVDPAAGGAELLSRHQARRQRFSPGRPSPSAE